MPATEFKPKWKHHATLPPRQVHTREQEERLGEGWTDTYQHQAYPSYRYHPTKAPSGKIVKDAVEHQALGEGWYATPADFPQTNATVEQSGPARTTTPRPSAAVSDGHRSGHNTAALAEEPAHPGAGTEANPGDATLFYLGCPAAMKLSTLRTPEHDAGPHRHGLSRFRTKRDRPQFVTFLIGDFQGALGTSGAHTQV